MSLQYVIFFLALAFYIYRFYKKTMSKAKEEAERRRTMNEDTGRTITQQTTTTTTTTPPKTFDEVLTDVFREVETKTKPFGQPPSTKQFQQRPLAEKKKAITPAPKPLQKPVVKKEPVSFLTNDYTPEYLEPEGTPSHMMADYMKKGELKDIYAKDAEVTPVRKKFNVREAVIANIILQRPEW